MGILLTESGAAANDWELVWSDEFDVNGLPDKTKWGYEEGFKRNKESQYYTRERLENARVEDGILILECRKENFQPENHDAVKYTAASLVTRDKASWTYGRIEVRAKLPEGKGVWPAIWMLGENITKVGWPRCGEIDIMEFVGKAPDRIHGTVHFAEDGKHRSNGENLQTKSPWEDFHVYAVEWTPEKINFFFDEKNYFSFSVDTAGEGEDNPFRKPQYLLINFALGGTWGGPFDDAILPQKFLVDYVRVYKAKIPSPVP